MGVTAVEGKVQRQRKWLNLKASMRRSDARYVLMPILADQMGRALVLGHFMVARGEPSSDAAASHSP